MFTLVRKFSIPPILNMCRSRNFRQGDVCVCVCVWGGGRNQLTEKRSYIFISVLFFTILVFSPQHILLVVKEKYHFP